MTSLTEAKAFYIGRKVRGNGGAIRPHEEGIVEDVIQLSGYEDGGIRLMVRDSRGNLRMWFWGYCDLIANDTTPLPLPG